MPVGFMPSPNYDGKVEIVICTGAGSSTILMDIGKVPARTNDEPHGGGNEADFGSQHYCPYAPVLAQGLPEAMLATLPDTIYESDLSFLLSASAPSDTALKPWFSQGPPVS